MTINPTPPVNSRYGAPMGRGSVQQGDVRPTDKPLYLRRIQLDSGGYDAGGAYWGHGAALWWCGNDKGDIDLFLRAPSREAAKVFVQQTYPEARFYK